MNEVNEVNVYDDGNPRTGVRVSRSSRWLRPGVVWGATLTCVLAMVSMTIMVVYLAPSVERLTENSSAAREERDELLDTIADLHAELAEIRRAQREERFVDDCISLYAYDIEIAKGVAQVALGDNLARAILLEQDYRPLAQAVFEADTKLRDALDALSAYQELDPPPESCPHPLAQDLG